MSIKAPYSSEQFAAMALLGLKPDVAYMPVPRCDTCRWWKPFDPALQPSALTKDFFGVSGLIPPTSDLGECRLFECRDMLQAEESSKLIVTRTRSGEATIVTFADFGCVQHGVPAP